MWLTSQSSPAHSDNTQKQSQVYFSGTFYLVPVHEGLAVAGSPPRNVGQRLAVSHTGDHGGAALYGCHVFQLSDVGLDCRPQGGQMEEEVHKRREEN